MVIAGRILRLLALSLWVGAIVFFGAVVARTAVQVFGTTQLFADFIGQTLLQLHSLGLWCGVALLVSLRLIGVRAYRLNVQASLALIMIVLTFVSNRAIILPMEHDRALAGGDIKVLMPGSPLREDFDARHAWSTRVEGAVLLCGIGLIVMIGLEAGEERRLNTSPSKVFDLSSDV
ncbi:MAG: DUF4149 domain-containing protein [Janthinobacterium lividum]